MSEATGAIFFYVGWAIIGVAILGQSAISKWRKLSFVESSVNTIELLLLGIACLICSR